MSGQGKLFTICISTFCLPERSSIWSVVPTSRSLLWLPLFPNKPINPTSSMHHLTSSINQQFHLYSSTTTAPPLGEVTVIRTDLPLGGPVTSLGPANGVMWTRRERARAAKASVAQNIEHYISLVCVSFTFQYFKVSEIFFQAQ